jgi:hypothetical protein
MANVLRCRDVGLDCEGEVRADTEEEILEKAAEHARTTSRRCLRKWWTRCGPRFARGGLTAVHLEEGVEAPLCHRGYGGGFFSQALTRRAAGAPLPARGKPTQKIGIAWYGKEDLHGRDGHRPV